MMLQAGGDAAQLPLQTFQKHAASNTFAAAVTCDASLGDTA